jgi:hypothetical protein
MKSNTELDRSQHIARRKSLNQDHFCSNIIMSQDKRPVFRHVVHKYKRNFHPTNASRGSQDMSKELRGLPRKAKLFQQ